MSLRRNCTMPITSPTTVRNVPRSAVQIMTCVHSGPSLRSDGPLWTQVMIWTALLGTFLTVVGLVIGIVQFRRRDISPYRGLFYWHHLAGLVFGIVTLTWVFSGLVSMNPWGFLESRGRGEQTLLQGRPLTWAQVRTSLAALPADLTPDIVRSAGRAAGGIGRAHAR